MNFASRMRISNSVTELYPDSIIESEPAQSPFLDYTVEVKAPLRKATRKVTLIIPCYNEAEGLGRVIDGIPHEKLKDSGFSLQVLVIDNNSTDNTAEVARSRGVRVVRETNKGKGHAIKRAFYAIDEDSDYVVMIDGDDTYKTSEIIRLLEPLESGFCDAVLGSRLAGRMGINSMKGHHRFGNWVFSILVRNAYKVNITDTLTGYFAWRYEVIEKMRPHIASKGFAIEMEMITTMARLDYEVYSVPITYADRAGESSLRPFRDGRRILSMFAKKLFWRPRQKNKVAFISDAVYPFHKGGKEKHLHEVSTRLAKKGRDVHIYTMKWWDGGKELVMDDIHYHAICKLHPMYIGERRSIKQGIFFSLACFKLLFHRFDVVNVDNIPFFPLFSMRLVCWLKRKKQYATWHEVWGREYWREYLGGVQGYFGYLVEKTAMRLPDTFIAVSGHTADRLKAAGVNGKIQTVPNGIDPEPIYASPRNDESFDIVYAGRLINHKNVDVLIEAIAKVREENPKIKGIIIGEGPERKLLEELVEKRDLGGNVRFQDFLKRNNELYGFIKASRMLVLPSSREGFGLIVAEANACDVPVITTHHKDNGARDLIIEGENGYLTDVNANDLAGKITRVLDDATTMTPLQTFRREFGHLNWNRAGDDFDRILV